MAPSDHSGLSSKAAFLGQPSLATLSQPAPPLMAVYHITLFILLLALTTISSYLVFFFCFLHENVGPGELQFTLS